MEDREVDVDELMAELRKNAPFYVRSCGGTTLSGGEPMSHHEFALALLKQCKVEGSNTAIDASGHAPWQSFEKILPYLDLALYDIKHIDSRIGNCLYSLGTLAGTVGRKWRRLFLGS